MPKSAEPATAELTARGPFDLAASIRFLEGFTRRRINLLPMALACYGWRSPQRSAGRQLVLPSASTAEQFRSS